MLNAFLIIASILIILYCLLFITYRKSFTKTPVYTPQSSSSSIKLDIIIPFRNEEVNLPQLLKELILQVKGKYLIRIILVDDHSTDNSFHIAKGFSDRSEDLSLYKLPLKLTGKKAAIKFAADQSDAEYLLFTDADTIPESGWLDTIFNYLQNFKPLFASAPVRMIPARDSFFMKFQALEFASLNGAGLASFMQNSPIMCNAANMVVKKDIFHEALKKIHPEIPTGDDIFLLQYVKKYYPDKIAFIKSPEAIVNTTTMPDFKSFLSQRSRWASKSLLYKDFMMIYVSLLVFLTNIFILILVFVSVFEARFLFLLAGVIAARLFSDYIFLRSILNFYHQKKLLKIFIPAFIIYPFYILVVSFSGFSKLFIRACQ